MLWWARIARTAARFQFLTQCRRLVVLDSSKFQHIISNEGCTPKNRAYAGDPLVATSCVHRGRAFETLTRRLLERTHADYATQDADAHHLGTCCNGNRRGLFQAEWDWVFMGRRVELKTSQLLFVSARDAWRVVFHKVKLARDGCRAEQPFDDLYLLIYAPDGFYLIKHDLKTGVAKAGARTGIYGHMIQVHAKRGLTWREGLQTILDKMTLPGCCDLVAYIPKSDVLAQAVHAEIISKGSSHASFYQGVPLFTMSSSTRSQRIQDIAYELDQLQNPNSIFHSAQGEVSPRGYKRGKSNAAVDWVRDGVRVEVKSAMLCRRGRDLVL